MSLPEAASSAVILALVAFGAVAAEPLPADPLEFECWQRSVYERTHPKLVEPTAVDVTNLRDGMSVSSPLRVDFSIRGMGVIPAGKPHPKAGHHHLLVNTPLPANPGDKIPFNDFHRHYGKGQTGTVIALPAGEHRLRLLFADHDHKPYFVFSPEIRITVKGPRGAPPKVTRANFDATCKAWYEEELSRPRPEGKRVLVANVRDGETLVSPVNLRLAADGFGIAPKGHGGDDLGWFILELQRSNGSGRQVLELSNGATQATVSLAAGVWNLRLRLVDDSGRRDLVAPDSMQVYVSGSER
jgi:Domain of unknown function (DUF4399)